MKYLQITFPLDDSFLAAEVEHAREMPIRRHMHVVVGGELQPIQALLNTFMQDSYARPHKHEYDEQFSVVRGRFAIAVFNDGGMIKAVYTIEEDESFTVPASEYHTAVCLSASGTLYEMKRTYYNAATDKQFLEASPLDTELDGAQRLLKEIRDHA